MPEVFFASKPVHPARLVGSDPTNFDAFLRANGLNEREMIQPGRAYSLAPDDPFTLPTLRRLNSLPSSERLCIAGNAQAMGDNAHILKVFFETHLSAEKLNEINGVVGAGATAAFARLDGFQQALVKYQEAVLNFARLHKAGGPGIGARRAEAERILRDTYQMLLKRYQLELNRISPEALRQKNRGNALSNPDRAITLASRSTAAKPDPRLFVADANDAGRMGTFSRVLNNTGRLAVAVDAGFRINRIHTVRESGGDWMRESAIQMAGFGSGGVFGGLAGKAVVGGGSFLAAKAGLIAAGPVGWTVLAVIVGAGVLAGFTVGVHADRRAQFETARIWDR